MKTYSNLVGYFTGISWMFSPYSIPFVMYHSGLAVGIVTLLVISIASFFPVLWILETMSRAEAMQTIEKMKANANMEQKRLSVMEVMSLCKIRTERRFELQELCKLFIGKPAGILCTLVILIYLWDWTSVAISATAFATNVPVGDHGTFLTRCTEEDFRFRVHPVGTCWNTYTFCVLAVGVLALITALTELGEMWLLQTVLAIVRFTTIGAMIVYSMVTDSSNKEDTDANAKVSWFEFSLRGFLSAVPTMVYAQLTVVAIPSISDPVDNKNGLAKMWTGIYFTASILSGIMGVTLAIRFKSRMNEIASLNWVSLSDSHNMFVEILSYWIVLYPSLEQSIQYGMTSIILANSVESQLFGGNRLFSKIDQSVHRFFWTMIRLIPPIFVSNLVTVYKYLSLVLFCLMFFIPGLLQYRSRNRWLAEIKMLTATASETFQQNNALESTALIGRELTIINDTPYSGWYSRTVVVIVVQVIGLLALSLTVTGLALPTSFQ